MLNGTRASITRRRLMGLAILVVVPVLIVIGTLRPEPWKESQQVWVMFDQAKGLAKVNRDVRVAGVNVGEIGEVIRVGDDAKIELVLTPEAGTVYRDATASLRPHAAFEGDAFIDLDPGTPGAGELGDAVLPKDQTTVYVALDEALRGLDAPRREAAANITEEQAETATPAAEQATGRTLDAAPDALRAAGTAAEASQGEDGDELRDTVRNLSLATQALGGRAPQVAEIVRDSERTLAAVGTDDYQALDATLVALPQAVADLRDNADTLVSVTRQVRLATTKAGPVLEEATPFLRAAAPLLRRSVPVLRDAPPLTKDLQQLLADFASSTPALRALIEPIDRSVGNLNTKALPSLHKTSRLGQPAYRQFLIAGAGLTGALAPYQDEGQNPLYGAGHYARVSGNVVDGLLGMTELIPGFGARARQLCESELRDATGQIARAGGCGG